MQELEDQKWDQVDGRLVSLHGLLTTRGLWDSSQPGRHEGTINNNMLWWPNTTLWSLATLLCMEAP